MVNMGDAELRSENVDRAVKGFISYTIASAQNELSKTRTIRGRTIRRVASGKLKASLYGKAFTKEGKTSIGFGSTTSYGKMIEYGVNGTRVKYGSPYSYTGENVNTDWVTNWAQSKGIQLDEGTTLNGLRYVIGRSLARNGIAPVPYMQLGIEAARKKFDDNLFGAFVKDLDNEIDKKLT